MSLRKLEMAKRIAKAETRIAGLHSINEHLDLGNGLTLDQHRSELKQLRDFVHDYNKLLADGLALRRQCLDQGRKVDEWNSRMLTGVALRYGRDSIELSNAGGVRTSERKKKSGRKRKGQEGGNHE